MSLTFQPMARPAAWTPVAMSWHCVFSHTRSTKVLPLAAGWVSGVCCGMDVGVASYCLATAWAAETLGPLVPGVLPEPDVPELLPLELAARREDQRHDDAGSQRRRPVRSAGICDMLRQNVPPVACGV